MKSMGIHQNLKIDQWRLLLITTARCLNKVINYICWLAIYDVDYCFLMCRMSNNNIDYFFFCNFP